VGASGERVELLGRQGKDTVSIPVPQIDIPRFRFGDKQSGGVGQGEGDSGDPVDGQEGEGDGTGKAGKNAGQHAVEVDVTLDDLAQILGEELKLPRIEPRGQARVVANRDKYTGIRRVGPESLRHFKRTFREALKRQVSSGIYNPERPVIVPIRDDKRFRSWKTSTEPVANAVIVYMMDGWDRSLGVDTEIDFALNHKLPVLWVEPVTYRIHTERPE
jgi:uncharacterized sporulation protein YeaH/YhbH (DUF444 family)